MIRQSVERLALVRHVRAAFESTQSQDVPLMHEGENNTEPSHLHLLHLLHLHLLVDAEAVIEHLIDGVDATNDVDVTIVRLHRLELDRNFLR